jgi:serine/threonine protein kinase
VSGILILERYEIIEKIGEGMQAEVFKVRDSRTDCIHAFAREKNWLQQLALPRIPCLIDLVEREDELGFIMEWINGVPLHEWMIEKDKGVLNRIAYEYMKLMIGILESCRSRMYEHMHFVDLKPEHVLIDAAEQLHVIDFGLCMTSDRDAWLGYGPTYFSDPQIDVTGNYNFQSDLYAIASVAMYILGAGSVTNSKYDSRSWSVGVPSWMIHLLLKMRESDITYRYKNLGAFFSDWCEKRIA